MLRLFSHPRFLAIYSGTLTLIFVATTATNLWRGPRRIEEPLLARPLTAEGEHRGLIPTL